MAARVRWQGTTTQRGYGNDHQRERKRLLALWRPGDLCARCGRPMWQLQRWSNGRPIAAIHLGHTADRTAYTGLEHDICNLREAAVRGNRLRDQRTSGNRKRATTRFTPTPARRW